MVNATETELERAGVTDTVEVVVADAGYWHQKQMESVIDKGDPGADPARRWQATRHQTGMERRCLRAHATSAPNRPWRGALRETKGDDRARVREHEVQPAHRPLPTPGKIRRTLRMETDHRHPQPAQAPQTPNSRRRGLTEPQPANPGEPPTPAGSAITPTSVVTTTHCTPFTQQPRRQAAAAPPAAKRYDSASRRPCAEFFLARISMRCRTRV